MQSIMLNPECEIEVMGDTAQLSTNGDTHHEFQQRPEDHS